MIRLAQYPDLPGLPGGGHRAGRRRPLLFPLWIRLLRVRNIGQQVRADGPQGHLVKQGTPTMGGVLILLVVTATFLLDGAARPRSACSRSARCSPAGFSASSTTGRRSRTSARSACARARSCSGRASSPCVRPARRELGRASHVGPDPAHRAASSTWASSRPRCPVGGMAIVVPWLYLALVFIMVTGMSNAVNLTDGLDGLAAGTVTIVTLAFAGIAFRQNALRRPRCSPRRSPARASASSGTTAIRPTSSWATRARSASAR